MCKLWYRSQVNKFSKYNVYSTQTILGVKSVSVKKLHRYGHLKEIVVKRVDHHLYKFKECDFMDLHLNEIEDMLLFAVQHKLFHLNESDIIDFIVALQSYQKKLNITASQNTFQEIEFKELYTPSYKPPRVIYKDLNKQKRVMRANELYKFSDETLKKVRDELHHRIFDFHSGYNDEMSRRKWKEINRKRIEVLRYDIKRSKVRKGINADEDKLMQSTGIKPNKVLVYMNLDSHHGPSDAMHNPPQPLKVFPMVAAAGPRRVRFMATCSYLIDVCNDIMKAQVHVSKDFHYSDTTRIP
ncbi:hypothetical protein Tco_1576834 [Tanacetum coccineum]